MVDATCDLASDRWLCPDDRQLALRGRLQTGWSTIPDTGYKKVHPPLVTEEEYMIIGEVMKRAAELEISEQIRIGGLVNHVEQTKKSLLGDGQTSCLVCGQKSHFLKEVLRKCTNCGRLVCNKCSVEVNERNPFNEVTKCFYCVVCSEERELWKRSGAWFFKMLPKHISPEDSDAMLINSNLHHENHMLGSFSSAKGYFADASNDYVDERRYSVDSDDSETEEHSHMHRPFKYMSSGSGDIDEEETLSLDDITNTSKANGMGNRFTDHSASHRHTGIDGEDELLKLPSGQSTFRKTSSRSMESILSANSQDGINQSRAMSTPSGDTSPRTSPAFHTEIDGGNNNLVRGTAKQKSTTERKEYHGALGIIEYRLQYFEHEQTLKVHIKSAKGLKAMDYGKSSDPYVKVYITPGHLKSTKHKTKVHYKTLDPEFNEEFTYRGVTENDLKLKKIKIVVMDENRLSSNACIGETFAALSSLINRPDQNCKRVLDPRNRSDAGPGDEDYRGKIQISLQYVLKKSKLYVGIERCVDLKPMDPNGYSDPYVKCYLLPDTNKSTKRKTRVVKKNLNPEFHQEFIYDVPLPILAGKTLLVSVWDRDVGASNDFIGAVKLGQNASTAGLKHWHETVKGPYQKRTYWHILSPELPTYTD